MSAANLPITSNPVDISASYKYKMFESVKKTI